MKRKQIFCERKKEKKRKLKKKERKHAHTHTQTERERMKERNASEFVRLSVCGCAIRVNEQLHTKNDKKTRQGD